MLEWLRYNLSRLSGSVVVLLGAFRPLLDWFMGDPPIRWVRKYVDLRAAHVEKTKAASLVDALLAVEVVI